MSLFRDLGLTPIINASGTVTRLGGAPMPQAVLDAFAAAASETVPLEQLQAAASKRIAAATGAEAGLVTSGAAASLTLGTAAILARWNIARMERLPDCDGFPNEFVVAREQRNGYDHAVRAAGARLVEVGFNELVANSGVRRTEAWEYEAAFGPATAGVFYGYSPTAQPPLEQVVECAHRHNLPVLVDAAAELPPRSNLTAIIATGADLVAFSGGKAIRGPQSTGILCGRRDLIGSAALQMLDMDDHLQLWDPPASLIDRSKFTGMPRHGIGRSLKVSKEEIAALLKAIELFEQGAYDVDVVKHKKWLETIATALKAAPVECRLIDPGDGETSPVLEIAVNESQLGRSAFDICRRLRNSDPPIYAGHSKLPEGILVIRPTCLKEGQIEPLVIGLVNALS
jgi:D-glucosaminate-6-phosphate ammonia-lyase